jgi:hypothetical protein
MSYTIKQNNPFSSENQRYTERLRKNGNRIRSDYHQDGGLQNHTEYYRLDDFDNKNAMRLKELEMLDGMGFHMEGNTHMGLTTQQDLDSNTYMVSKHKKLGYELKINERKHYFRTFDEMLAKIDEFGKLEI